jgi:hypothetical protein
MIQSHNQQTNFNCAAKLTFDDDASLIRPVPVARQMLLHTHPTSNLLLQQIKLVQKQDEVDFCEQRRRADGFPEEKGVFQAVDGGGFCQVLVEAGDGGEEDYGIYVIEVGAGVLRLVGITRQRQVAYSQALRFKVRCQRNATNKGIPLLTTVLDPPTS